MLISVGPRRPYLYQFVLMSNSTRSGRGNPGEHVVIVWMVDQAFPQLYQGFVILHIKHRKTQSGYTIVAVNVNKVQNDLDCLFLNPLKLLLLCKVQRGGPCSEAHMCPFN